MTSSSTIDIPTWLQENTYLQGRPFSFKNHNYQVPILRSKFRENVIRKCSQTGITEISLRRAIALCLVHSGFNALLVYPTAGFASNVAATRLNLIIDSSPLIRSSVHKDTDSNLVKRWVNDSLIFMKGASKTSQTISTPADGIFIDERDFCEESVISDFQSRLTHSPHKIVTNLSTPTFSTHGVTALFDSSIRHWPFHKCSRCGHPFVIDYHDHVRLPGLGCDLREIGYFNKDPLLKLDLEKAYVECPKCKRPTTYTAEGVEYVAENPDSGHTAGGWQITPFCAPAYLNENGVQQGVSLAGLITDSAKYRNVRSFYNNSLGKSYDDEESGLTAEEVSAMFTPTTGTYPDKPTHTICGMDMGGTCATLWGSQFPDGHLRIYHAECIPLIDVRRRFLELQSKMVAVGTVADAFPHTSLIIELQDMIPSMFGAVTTQSRSLDLYTLRQVEEDRDKATFGLRQINFKKNPLMDLVMNMVRARKISFAPSCLPERDRIIKHLTELKRMPLVTKHGEEIVWKKSEHADHYHFALAFLVLSTYIQGLSHYSQHLPFLLKKVKTKGNF